MNDWSIPQEKLDTMADVALAWRALILALVDIDQQKKGVKDPEAGQALEEMAPTFNQRFGG